MPKKFTQKEAEEKCKKAGHKLISAYIHSEKNADFICGFCGNIFSCTPKSIWDKHTKSCGCKNKNKSYTNSILQKSCEKVNIKLLSNFKTIDDSVKYICLLCGKEYNRPLKGILSGYTHSCRCKKIKYRLEEKDVIKRCEELDIKYVRGFTTTEKRCTFKCFCGREFECIPSNVFSGSTKSCGNCGVYRNGVATSYLALDIHHIIDPEEKFSLHNHQLTNPNCNVDIYIPHKKLVIEVDCTHWHKNPQKDDIKHCKIREMGYNILVVVTKENRPTKKQLRKKIHDACNYGKSYLVI